MSRVRINVEEEESPTSKKIKSSGYYSPIHELLHAAQTPKKLETFFSHYSPRGIKMLKPSGTYEEFDGFFHSKRITIQKKGVVTYRELQEDGSHKQKSAEKFILKFGSEILVFYSLAHKQIGHIAVLSEKDLDQIDKFCEYCKKHDLDAFEKIGFKHVDIFEIDDTRSSLEEEKKSCKKPA